MWRRQPKAFWVVAFASVPFVRHPRRCDRHVSSRLCQPSTCERCPPLGSELPVASQGRTLSVNGTAGTAHYRHEPGLSVCTKPRRVKADQLRKIVADRRIETDLAWDLAEAIKPHLTIVDRNHVYVRIGIGETFAAIHWLITSAATNEIALPIALIQRCGSWLDGYAGHSQQQYLSGLIKRVLAGGRG